MQRGNACAGVAWAYMRACCSGRSCPSALKKQASAWLTCCVSLALPPTREARVTAEELMDAGLEIRMDCSGSESENGLLRVTLNVSLSAFDNVTTTLPCNASRCQE